MSGRYALGIDLGGTNLKAGLVDRTGKILAMQSCRTQAEKGPGHFVGQAASLTDLLISSRQLERGEIVGAGLGTPGPLDLAAGKILKAANLPGWIDVPIRDELATSLRLPVIIENDANAAAYGEFWCGRQGQCSNMVLLTLGTGVGAGVIVEGKLLHGHFDNAAELGHMIVVPNGLVCRCGQRGCLEAYASAGAIARRFHQAMKDGQTTSHGGDNAALDSKAIAKAAQEGELLSRKLWDESCLYLAIAIINVQHAYNPELVLLGGGMAEAGDFLLENVRARLDAHRWRLHDDVPRVEVARLGSEAGLIGAAGLAWQRFASNALA